MRRHTKPPEGFECGTVLVQFRSPLNPDPTADPCTRVHTTTYAQSPECVVFMSVQSSDGADGYHGPTVWATYIGTVRDGSGRVVPANLAPYLGAEGGPWSKPFNTRAGTSTDVSFRSYYREELHRCRAGVGQYHLMKEYGALGDTVFTWDGKPRTAKELHAHLKSRLAKGVRL